MTLAWLDDIILVTRRQNNNTYTVKKFKNLEGDGFKQVARNQNCLKETIWIGHLVPEHGSEDQTRSKWKRLQSWNHLR